MPGGHVCGNIQQVVRNWRLEHTWKVDLETRIGYHAHKRMTAVWGIADACRLSLGEKVASSGLKMAKTQADSKRRQNILRNWTVTYVTPSVSFCGLPHYLKVTSASCLRILPKRSVHVATWEGVTCWLADTSYIRNTFTWLITIATHYLPGQNLVSMDHGIFFLIEI